MSTANELRSVPGRLALAVAVGVAVLAVLVYANSLANGFAYDDVTIIERRDLVHGLERVGELLRAEYWPERYSSGLYRPLTLLSFAVEWSVWRGNPVGFHLTNVLLHAAVSAAVALLLLRFFPWWAGLAGGAVFAVHPVHTEVVANVVGRGELLAAGFTLLACLIYVSSSRRDRFTWGSIALISGCYAAALLSKEIGIVLPALLLLSDLTRPANRVRSGLNGYLRRRAPAFLALASVMLGFFALRWLVLGTPLQHVANRTFVPDATFTTRLFTMARVWPRYLELLLFPTQLNADYAPPVILPASELTGLGALGIFLAASFLLLALSLLRRAPELSLAVGWGAVALLPVSNLIVIAEIVLAERTLYLASVAVAIVAALVLAQVRSTARRHAVLGVGLWVLGFAVVTVKRNPVWATTETVLEDVRRRYPDSSRALWWEADDLLQEGDWEGARDLYRRSLRAWPYHAPYLAQFALQLNDRSELAEAELNAARAVELAPEYADHHSLLALIRLRRGDFEGVLRTIARGLEATGGEPVFFKLRAEALAGLGRYGEAVADFRAYLRLRDGPIGWREWLSLALLQAGAGDTAAARASLDSLRRAPGADLAAADSLAAELQGLP